MKAIEIRHTRPALQGWSGATVDSSWYGPMPAPTSYAELAEALSWLHEQVLDPGDVDRPQLFFRGQADHRWRLTPGLTRRLRPRPMHPLGIRVEELAREYEQALMADAAAVGVTSVDQPLLQQMAELQHYGAATRLLDFSFRPNVALWFAMQGDRGVPGLLFAFEDLPAIEPTRSLGNLSENLRSFQESLDGTDPFMWAPVAQHSRMLAQQSVFVVSVLWETDWSDIPVRTRWQTDSRVEALPEQLHVIYLSPELKQGVTEAFLTKSLGLNQTSMFPDLPGFSLAHSATQPLPAFRRWRRLETSLTALADPPDHSND